VVPLLEELASAGLAEEQKSVVWEPVEYLQSVSVRREHEGVDLTLLIHDGFVLYVSRSNGKATDN
jgi:hypothetical protein